jgi:CRISPR-associated endonuclease/helicase Cas3
MKFYSHKNKKLINHLENVSIRMISNLPESLINKKRVLEIVGACHDFGKYTTYFQNRLFEIEDGGDKANHALISSFYCAYCLEREKAINNNIDDLDLIIAYNVIKSHHSFIKEANKNIPTNNIDKSYEYNVLRILNIQSNNLKKNKMDIMEELKLFSIDKYFVDFLKEENLIKIIKRLSDIWFEFELEDKTNLGSYFLHNYSFSKLVSSDKLDASNTPEQLIMNLNYEYLRNKMLDKIGSKNNKKSGKNELNIVRNEIYNTVISNISKNSEKNIFTITAPTGSGKTYTGFMAAKALQTKLPRYNKIIYALPFTSIIDQNYDVIVNLMKSSENFRNNPGNYIIKHHYLGDGKYVSNKNNGKEISLDQQNLLIEDWQSGIVVTTFVQLFQTLIGTSNKMLKKFHNIDNSIIILDEIQSIDSEYYQLVEEILRCITEYLSTKIIIMTATKPHLLKGSSYELLDSNSMYFEIFNRTKLHIDLDEITIDEFIEEFVSNYDKENDYLIVCNTIGESLDIYKKISEALDYIRDIDIKYLSTNIIPQERLKRVDEIKRIQKENEKNIILISTQVIEAGVDLDFDVVYRDLAPVDSVIQCAGRCNRNNSGKKGDVYVKKLVNENNHSFSKFIYHNLSIVENSFSNYKTIEEKEYSKLIEEYFKLLRNKSANEKSKQILKSMRDLDFKYEDKKEKVANFSLIKNKDYYIDVIICINREIEHRVDLLKELYMDKKNNYERIKSINKFLLNYTISIPKKNALNIEKLTYLDIFIVRKDDLSNNYDDVTGFKRKNNPEDNIL